MTRKKTTPESRRGTTLRRAAERIIAATGAVPPAFSAAVQQALDAGDTARLRELVAGAKQIEAESETFKRSLHAFASHAYMAALKFFTVNNANPAALRAYKAALTPAADATERTAARLVALLSDENASYGAQRFAEDIINDLAGDVEVWPDHPALVRAFYVEASKYRGSVKHDARLAKLFALIDAGETFADFKDIYDTLEKWEKRRAAKKGKK